MKHSFTASIRGAAGLAFAGLALAEWLRHLPIKKSRQLAIEVAKTGKCPSPARTGFLLPQLGRGHWQALLNGQRAKICRFRLN